MADLPAAGRSVRVELARVARDAALATPGVLSPNAGPLGLHVTLDGTQRLDGVSVAAQDGPGERYAVDLFLTVALVPLPPLVGEVRRRVARSAHLAGLDGVLGDVNVSVLDVGVPDLAGAS